MDIEKIKLINEDLAKGEPENISVDDYTKYTGYAPQYIINAVNKQFLGNWNVEVLDAKIQGAEKSQVAVVKIRLTLNGVSNDTYGQSRVTRGDYGDALKGAETDAIKKGFSLFSIGEKAYRGKLQVK